MKYRLTLVDAPPDSAIGGFHQFETWEETQEQVFFVVTRANHAWSAMAIEQWRPSMAGKWVLKGYASQTTINELIAEAADTEESREQFRRRLWRVLQRGCTQVRKEWERQAVTRAGESLAPYLARAAAKGCGIRISAREVLRLQESKEVISLSVSLVNRLEERCGLCGLDYGECNENGTVVSFESVCEHCALEAKEQRQEKRRKAVMTARAKRQKDSE